MRNDLVRFQQFDAFLCYNESNAKSLAQIIHDVLSIQGINVFVAHLERKTYSDDFNMVRRIVIDRSKFFIFVNTQDALNSEQIINEFKMAYPDGLKESPELKVMRLQAPDVQYSNPQFENQTGLNLKNFNQIPFVDESELVREVIRLFKGRFDQMFTSIIMRMKPRIFNNEKTIFVGRENELRELNHLLSSNKQVISLVGVGGIGKSALAFKAIHQCEDRFHCIIQVSLDSDVTFATFLTIIGRGLSIENELVKLGDEKTRAQFIGNILSNIESGLLFLDNFENISNQFDRAKVPDNIRDIRSFLEGIPENVKIIVTSRNWNNILGEHNLTVQGLSKVDGRMLFLEISKNYVKTPSRGFIELLDKILDDVEGHALGIKLLAASYRGHGMAELNDIRRRLIRDIKNPSDSNTKHISLTNCFDYSYDCLQNRLKNILKILSIFNSPFSTNAAKYVTNEERSIFVKLYERGWLRKFEPYVIDSDQESEWIYEFHPLIKEYLESQMERNAELKERYLDRICDYYRRFIFYVFRHNEKVSPLASSLIIDSVILRSDNDLERAINTIGNAEARSECSNHLGLILYEKGYYRQGLAYHQKCLQIDEDQTNYIRILNDYDNIGSYYLSIGNYPHALMYYLKAKEITDNYLKDSKDHICNNHINLAMLFLKMGLLTQTWIHFIYALKVNKQLKNLTLSAMLYGNLGAYYSSRGLHNVALICFRYAKRIDETLGRSAPIASDLRNMGNAFKHLGNVKEALKCNEEALTTASESNLFVAAKTACDNIVELLNLQGDAVKAEVYERLASKIEEQRVIRKMPNRYHDTYTNF